MAGQVDIKGHRPSSTASGSIINFITVTLTIVTGNGLLSFEKYDNARVVGEQTMQGLGMLKLTLATSVSLFIIIHQGSN